MTRRRIEVMPYGDSAIGQWFWREKAGNGRVIFVAEGFDSKANAVSAAKRQSGRYRIAVPIVVVSKERDRV